MSTFQFLESQSPDPVERALARRVTDVLANPRLTRAEREAEVRQAQRELLAHRQQQAQRQALLAWVQALPAAKKRDAVSVQVCAGRVQLGLRGVRQGFAWQDAGAAPPELGEAVAAVPLAPTGKLAQVGRKAVIDPIAARRRELRRTPDKPA
ncbi:MAG: hypothetical protein R3E52_11765 [Burkholderiaceae bacterium]